MSYPDSAIPDIENATAPKLNFFRRKRRAQELVNKSMATSRFMLHGSSSWSSHTGPEGRLVLKFPLGWQNPLCPVQRWYKAQQARSPGQKTSTSFNTIEHHRSLEGPFFHEFLLIPLSDGSGYRTERTGVGSNADAVSPKGCSANDLIEWFPADKFQLFARSDKSILIAGFTLDCELDILNVLATCYSICQEKQTKSYTLQRYNCYFYCCTLLAILVRRVANWENMITDTHLQDLLDATLARLSHLSTCPLSDLSRKHLLLRLFSGLKPESQQPMQSLIDALKKTMGSEASVLNDFNRALAATVWESHYQPAMNKHLVQYIKAAVLEACEHDNVCDQALHPKNQPSADNKTKPSFPFLSISAQIMASGLSSLMVHFEEILPALERQEGIPRVGVFFFLVFLYPLTLVVGVFLKCLYAPAKGTSVFRLALALKFLPLCARYILVDAAPCDLSNPSTLLAFEIPALHAALDYLEEKGAPAAHINMAIGYVFEASLIPQPEEWGEILVGSLHNEILVEELVKLQLSLGSSIRVYRKHDGHESSSQMHTFEVQAYLKEHIEYYAHRVDTYQLSGARSVQRDVQAAITRVWRAMPEGFGSRTGSQAD